VNDHIISMYSSLWTCPCLLTGTTQNKPLGLMSPCTCLHIHVPLLSIIAISALLLFLDLFYIFPVSNPIPPRSVILPSRPLTFLSSPLEPRGQDGCQAMQLKQWTPIVCSRANQAGHENCRAAAVSDVITLTYVTATRPLAYGPSVGPEGREVGDPAV
jgi:hypothetical protein